MDTVSKVYGLKENRKISLFQLARISEIPYSTLSNIKRQTSRLNVDK